MRLLLFFLFFYQFCPAQNNLSKDSNYIKLLNYALSRCDSIQLENYCEAIKYFEKGSIDSCYLISQKVIIENKIPKDDKDFLQYLSGSYILKKGLPHNALIFFNSISKNFRFTHILNFKYGLVYLELKEYDKSITIYEKWLKENPIGKNINEVKAAYHNLATAYLFKKKYKQAEKNFKKRLYFSINENDTLSIIRINSDLANLYYEQYKDNLAIPLFKKAYELAKNKSDFKLKQNTAKNMAIVEKNRKHYQKSIKYYEEYNRWKDSIWNRDKISELLEKEKEIALKEKEKKIIKQKALIKFETNRKHFFIILLIITSSFLIILSYLYKSKIIQNKLINKQNKELDNLNTTKNYLISVISHDLRSPTNTLLKQEKQLTKQIASKNFEKIKSTTNNIIKLTKNLQHLLNNLLNWSLQQNDQLIFQKDNHNLKTIIEHVTFDFENFAEASKIKISTFLEDIYVNLDKESLKIVLRNLIDNAIKYTPENGSIEINLKKINNNRCCLTIKDTGIGISPEQLKEFETLKKLNINHINRSKGIGLGLLLCTSLIKKNNGNIIIKSKPENGTSIDLFFEIVTVS